MTSRLLRTGKIVNLFYQAEADLQADDDRLLVFCPVHEVLEPQEDLVWVHHGHGQYLDILAITYFPWLKFILMSR